MEDILVPIVIMTGMFAMIFGVVYVRSRENMALIERGLNPRQKDPRPRPFINLKWGLLLIGSGLGLLLAYIIDTTVLSHNKVGDQSAIRIGGHHTISRNGISITADSTQMKVDSNAAMKPGEEQHEIVEIRGMNDENPALYFALIAIGGGLGLFTSYRIEKKEWLDKQKDI